MNHRTHNAKDQAASANALRSGRRQRRSALAEVRGPDHNRRSHLGTLSPWGGVVRASKNEATTVASPHTQRTESISETLLHGRNHGHNPGCLYPQLPNTLSGIFLVELLDKDTCPSRTSAIRPWVVGCRALLRLRRV